MKTPARFVIAATVGLLWFALMGAVWAKSNYLNVPNWAAYAFVWTVPVAGFTWASQSMVPAPSLSRPIKFVAATVLSTLLWSLPGCFVLLASYFAFGGQI
jgi:hypothetical protein